jgi:hypothetical protein
MLVRPHNGGVDDQVFGGNPLCQQDLASITVLASQSIFLPSFFITSGTNGAGAALHCLPQSPTVGLPGHAVGIGRRPDWSIAAPPFLKKSWIQGIFARCESRVTLRLRNGILDFGNALFGPIEVDRGRNGVAENWKNILKRREHLSVNAPQSVGLIRKLRRVYDQLVEIGIKVRV